MVKMVNKKLLFTFYLWRATLGLLECDLQLAIATNPVDHFERRQCQVRGLVLSSISIHLEFVFSCIFIPYGEDFEFRGCAHWRGFRARTRANGASFP